jgi:Flp pilus assembly protein TadD
MRKLALVVLWACGGAEAPAKSPNLPVIAAPSASTAAPASRAPETRTEPALTPGPAPAPAPAPPPKPLTFALVDAADESPYALLIRQGDQATEANKPDQAKVAYEKAKALEPKRAPAIAGLARASLIALDLPMDYATGKGNKKLQTLAAEFKKAAELENSAPGRATVEYGRTLLLLGDAKGALEQLQRASSSVREEAEVFSSIGVALLALGRGKEAVEPMKRAASLDSGSAARQGNLGTVLLMQGQVKGALEAYQSASSLAPNDARAHSDLGTAYLADDQLDKALIELREAVRLEPKRATFRSNLGYALQRKGDKGAAQTEYEEAIKLDGKLVSAWINLATLLAQEPSTRKRARTCLETAAKLDPQDPRVRPNLEELDALEKKP